MRLPAGYGQVIKLSGKRRKPYAVRVRLPVSERPDGTFYKPVKYLEYFEKRSDALRYLSEYNAGVRLPEHKAITSAPTFAEVWEGFIAFRRGERRGMSDALYASYRAAYNNMIDLHHQRFCNLRPDDLQAAVNSCKHLSHSSVTNIMIVLHGMYRYAMRQEIVDKDYSALISSNWTDSDTPAHVPFTDDEISRLWEMDARIPLIFIYTGLRGSEFLYLHTDNVFLDKRYFTGGSKTNAGKNRIIPIHEKIVPFIAELCSGGLLFPNSRGTSCHFNSFYNYVWRPEMERVGMVHKPHDARHTFASLMERFDVPLLHRKLILGHAVKDITEGVYTHIPPDVLVSDVNKITL